MKLTLEDVRAFLKENISEKDVVELRKEIGIQDEVTFDTVRAWMHEHSSDPVLAEYRIQLSKINEVNLKAELAANYEKVKPNPFKAGSFNLTEQGNVYRTDRLMYDALRQAVCK